MIHGYVSLALVSPSPPEAFDRGLAALNRRCTPPATMRAEERGLLRKWADRLESRCGPSTVISTASSASSASTTATS